MISNFLHASITQRLHAVCYQFLKMQAALCDIAVNKVGLFAIKSLSPGLKLVEQ